MLPLYELFATPDQVADFLMLPLEEQYAILGKLAALPDTLLTMACSLDRPGWPTKPAEGTEENAC